MFIQLVRNSDTPHYSIGVPNFSIRVEGRAADAEFCGGLCQVALVARQGLRKQLFFQAFTGFPSLSPMFSYFDQGV